MIFAGIRVDNIHLKLPMMKIVGKGIEYTGLLVTYKL